MMFPRFFMVKTEKGEVWSAARENVMGSTRSCIFKKKKKGNEKIVRQNERKGRCSRAWGCRSEAGLEEAGGGRTDDLLSRLNASAGLSCLLGRTRDVVPALHMAGDQHVPGCGLKASSRGNVSHRPLDVIPSLSRHPAGVASAKIWIYGYARWPWEARRARQA